MKFEFFGHKFTEADLQKSEQEYVDIVQNVSTMNPDDPEAKNAYLEKIEKAKNQYHKIHKSLHPEMYKGDRKNAIILPKVDSNIDNIDEKQKSNTSPNDKPSGMMDSIGIGH